MPESPEEKEKQLIVTLALVQKALQDLADKVNVHQKVLFGNGDPQNSVTWCLRGLMDSVKRIEEQFKEFTSSAAIAKKEASDAVIAANAAKELAQTVASTAEKLANTVNNSKPVTEDNLTWSQTIKKILIKAPWVVAAIVIVSLLNKPATDLMIAIVKLITK